ncbi:HK97 gp10 family phage protein [Streptococcus thermophilus]|nr:HK97 gp10 family phage protein [Streptococcus thermophilus]MDA5537975.1 HK97 gp10 family phage protein [Streptococcus thermophilus]MDA5552512.1 HK97 gp10 family phage protein [Streptococcus thermophilus]WCL61110.1 HK97 gp10 family phage protein [Streptococcus thermophilus]
MGNLTPSEQAKITNAGAKVFKKELEEVTREKHYSRKKNPKFGHMADGLAIQATNADGRKNGVSTVGWKNNYHAQNARRLNDGTKKYRSDHFVTNVQNDSTVQKKVLLAEKEQYEKLIRRKGGM